MLRGTKYNVYVRKPFRSLQSLYAATAALAATAGVLGNGCSKPCILRFYYRLVFKRCALLSALLF